MKEDEPVGARPLPGASRLEEAARALVVKLLEIHDDPRYEAVWTCAHVHGMPYKGPTYERELKALQDALAAQRPGEPLGEPVPDPNPPGAGPVSKEGQ